MAPFNLRDITVVVTAAYPARVLVRLRLEFSDTCTDIEAISQSRSGNQIDLAVATKRNGEACAEVLRSVGRELWLEGAFEAGTYIVRAHGVERQFVI